MVYITGTPNQDIDDVLPGLLQNNLGNDDIRGFGGHDIVYGGLGNDTLYGNGSGRLSGRDNDRLYGEIGDDLIYGNEGHDRLDGGIGNDKLYGGTGHDVLIGDEGNDFLYGETGNDFLIGGSLLGVLSTDVLNGGRGNDRLKAQFFGNVKFNGYGGDLQERDILEGSLTTVDTFILGTQSQLFYARSGNQDYALIRNFTQFGEYADKVVLGQGSSSQFVLDTRPVAGIGNAQRQDTLLHKRNANGTVGELVAVFQDTTGLDLNSGAFVFG